MPRLSGKALWFFVLIVALAVRLAAGAWWQSRMPAGERFLFGDSNSYWELGRAIAHGGPYQYGIPERSVFRTPGYPLLLSPLFLLWGDDPPVMAARALSAVCGTLAVAIVGWWATRLFDARTGIVAATIAAVYPGSVAMGAFVLSEAPFCPWMLLHLGLWGLAWRAGSTGALIALAATGGACGAIATLSAP